MHPLDTYLRAMKASCTKRGEFGQKRRAFAEQIGVSELSLHRYINPNQNGKLALSKAFRIELLTHGQVPANSLHPDVEEILSLAQAVDAQRRRLAAPPKAPQPEKSPPEESRWQRLFRRSR